MYAKAQCGGIHGHVVVSPVDGTVYIPNRQCGIPPLGPFQQGVIVSTDNGLTWTIHTIPGSSDSQSDPAVGIGSDGTVYVGYVNGDGHPHLVASHDKGVTWVNDKDVGISFGIQNAVFPAVAAGDGDRAAFAFIGTPTGGDYQATATFPGVWHMYVATTYEGGANPITVDTTPDDPVQRGSICAGGTGCGTDRNLLDFFGATVDKQGRFLVGYADGCVDACVQAAPNSFTAKATIARQAGGRRLFAAYDPVEPEVPGAPQVSETRDTHGVHLSWPAPDNGGSPITGYRVYRSQTADSGFALLGTTAVAKFDDSTAAHGVTYYYRVTALNAVGESGWCLLQVVPPPDPPDRHPCVLPGDELLNDPSGDAFDAQSGHDAQSLHLAEPVQPDASKRLVFTLKVASLSSVPPGTTWPVAFTGADGNGYYVAMVSSPTSVVSFEYGTAAVAAGGTYGALVKVGSLDPLTSLYSADGTIVFTVDDSAVGGGSPGDALSDFLVRVAVDLGVGTFTPDNMPDSLAGAGTYVLVGNASCRPDARPLASLTATPTAGKPPLLVGFDASASIDPDGDTITSFSFDFGDGTIVQQATPTISHTYNGTGEFNASVVVTDARLKSSVNSAHMLIQVDVPIPAITSFPTPINAANQASAPVSGTTDGNDVVTVSITDGVKTVTKTVAASAGSWSTTVDVHSLADGPVVATATATDSLGNVSDPSGEVTATKATVGPAAPVITSITDPISAATQAAVVVSGTGVAGTTINLNLVDQVKQSVTTSTPARQDGTWSTTVDVHTVADGIITATATATNPSGNTGSVSTAVTSRKDTLAPAAPTITGFTNPVTSTNQTVVHLTGTAESGSNVRIVIRDSAGRTAIVTTTAPGGQWSVEDDLRALADGALTATAFSTDVAGNASAASGAARSTKETGAGRLGYRMAAADGGIFDFGRDFFGSTGDMRLNQPIVGMAATPDGAAYWLVASDGGIFAFGTARFFGSTGDVRLNKPVVGMAATADGLGYWLVPSDGGIFAFGNAGAFGSMGDVPLTRPVVGMAATSDGAGYWLVASDGGIFAFGNARFSGSTGDMHLNRPIVGMAATADGLGYWLVASDGGIFAFGNAGAFGSMGDVPLSRPVVGMAATSDGAGYWLVASDGGIFAFGNARFSGSTGDTHLNRPIVGMAA